MEKGSSPLSLSFASIVLGIEILPLGRTAPIIPFIGAVALSLWYDIGRELVSPLGPHDLHHTFAKSLLDPAAYGLDRQPLPLPAFSNC